MLLNEDIICPLCEKNNVDTVAFIYRSLKSKGAGRKLFSEGLAQREIDALAPHQRESLMRQLTPPKEPHISLPAGAIALMAFLISWLATSSVIIAWVGEKAYFVISVVVTVVMGFLFYSMLKTVITSFRKKTERYRALLANYNKHYFCHACLKVFVPKQ